jgi:hypothetical protein
MESLLVTEVYTNSWNKVSLVNTYISPIAVCSIEYNTGVDLEPAVVRMRNLGSTSFEITLQIVLATSGSIFRVVHCVVVERGSWKMRDGRSIEARKYLSSVTDKATIFVGQQQKYLNKYKNPIVLGQVMTYNDPRWSMFWSRGSVETEAPDKENLWTGKHIGGEVDTRTDETVGYIVIETGHDTLTTTDIEIETKRGIDVTAYVDGSVEYRLDTFDNDFSEKPAVAVLSQAGMNGKYGSWAVLAEISSASVMKVALDEDGFNGNDRKGDAQVVDYIVFSAVGIVQLTTPTPTMESMVVPNVILHDTWTTVDLTETYWQPIAVCTVKYNTDTDLLPAVVRMKNVLSKSFEIRIQNPKGYSSADKLRDVHCVVVEQGSWIMPDTRKIEANKYLSTVTDFGKQGQRQEKWEGERRLYVNSYDEDPIVLGQVMSYNEPQWCVFWSRGSSREYTPDKEYLYTGKHVGQGFDVEHADETVGYIVIEQGHLTSDGIEIETARGQEIRKGYVEGSSTYTFDKPFMNNFSFLDRPFRNFQPVEFEKEKIAIDEKYFIEDPRTPAVAVLSQVGMHEIHGSWAVLADITSFSTMEVAVDEEQIYDDGRILDNGGPEILDYVVFSAAGVVQLITPDPTPSPTPNPSTAPSLAPSLAPSSSPAPSSGPTTIIEGRYIGCYRDKEDDRDLPISKNDRELTSIKDCLNYCGSRSFQVAGLQNGGECWCGFWGDEYGKYGYADNCNMNCERGEGTYWGTCGGAYANSIYHPIY